MAQIDFSAAYRDSTKGATLKALALRRQQAAEEQSAAMQPRQMTSPWQGAAQMAETAVGGLREGLAASQETAGRQRLAELLAGGISPEEMGEATILDPELAGKWQEHAWETEAKAAEAAAREKELLRSHGWDVDTATARVQAETAAREDQQAAERDAAKLNADAKVAADKAARSGSVEDRDLAIQAAKDAAAAADAAKVKAAETAADVAEKTAKTAADVEAAKPQSGAGKIMQDFNNNVYGDKNTPAAQAQLKLALAKENAISGKSQTISIDKDGNVTVTDASGPGAITSSTQDVKNQANAREGYRAAAQSANDVKATVANMQTALAQTGHTGFGGQLYQGLDKALETVGGMTGGLVPSLPGRASAGELLTTEGIEFIKKNVASWKGAISNYEDQLFAAASPGLDKTREGNTVMLAMADAAADRALERDKQAEEWLKTNPDLSGFEVKWSDYVNKNRILDVDKDGNYIVAGKKIAVPEESRLFGFGGEEGATAAPAATTPAPAASGGATAAPAEDYQEGDVVSSPGQPDLILRNGKWVPK